MKKILIIGTTNIYGGVGHIMFEFCQKLDNHRFSFDFLYYRNASQQELQLINKLSGHFYRVPRYSRHPFKFIKSIKKFYLHHHYDIVHIYASTAMLMIYTFPIWNSKNSKIIYHSHAEAVKEIGNKILHQYFKRVVVNYSDYKLAVSQKAAKHMYGKKHLHDVYILKNGFELSHYEYTAQIRKKIRKDLNLDNQFVVGHVGRFSYPKNHPFIIEVFSRICKLHSNSILLLIGSGEDEDKIHRLVEKKGLTKQVIFFGTTEQTGDLLCSMDCFFFPSHFEGLGIAVLEAQMNGLPVVMSDQIPIEAKATDLCVSMSLTKNTIDEWAKKILSFHYIKEDRYSHYEDLSAHGYDITLVIKKLEDIYQEA